MEPLFANRFTIIRLFVSTVRRMPWIPLATKNAVVELSRKMASPLWIKCRQIWAMAVFETRDMFLIYRDADKYLPLPKVVVGDDAQGLRELFARELGRSFHVRV